MGCEHQYTIRRTVRDERKLGVSPDADSLIGTRCDCGLAKNLIVAVVTKTNVEPSNAYVSASPPTFNSLGIGAIQVPCVELKGI